jgi:hypothetical protein
MARGLYRWQTVIDNRLIIKSLNGWAVNEYPAQLLIQNTTTNGVEDYSIAMYAGAKYGIQTRSLIANVSGSTCIVNTKNDKTEDSTCIILCGMHASLKRGLKIDLTGLYRSEYHGSTFEFNSHIMLQPIGKTPVNVYDTIIAQGVAIASILTQTNNITTNATNIASNLVTINTQNTQLTNIENKTRHQRSTYYI